MQYQGEEIEILSKSKLFGKEVDEIRILSTSQIKRVLLQDIKESEPNFSIYDISFKAVANRIKAEILKQSILSPYESNIIPLPHQILALEKIMQGNYMRFLLADEVGMGKTIEAGLVLKELKLRGIVKRCLIIVGKTAMLQWQSELKQHFNEVFKIYDTEFINLMSKSFARLELENEVNIWAQSNQIIVPLDALRPIEQRSGWSKQRVEEYNKFRIESVLNADFDLLIIDECHKVGGSTQLVARFQMAEILSNAIPNLLLLSATPHRGKSDHFRRILQLLNADAFAGEGMPELKELEPYVIRTEKRNAIDFNGAKLFKKRITKKITVPYDDIKHYKQQQLYKNVSEYVINGFNLAKQTRNNSYGFVMLLFQKMMSSSTKAILDAMETRANRLRLQQNEVCGQNLDISENIDPLDDTQEIEKDIFSIIADTKAKYEAEIEILNSLIKDAKECYEYETDAKVEYLLKKLEEIKRESNNPDIKVLIFTEFISTQEMLKQKLEINGGFRCEIINGTMDFDRRIQALKNFKNFSQILISTDAGGESLNMQFCNIVFNYDMPWNPMILEQRIGRVDRIGQLFDVQAFNIMLENSIERRVYEVIETKLTAIMNELGIDKTADVLDSTIERESLNKLYLTSLLTPENFEKESTNWLEEIKAKLLQYKSTENVLPSVKSNEINADKVEAIKHSPIPKLLENLTKYYLNHKKIAYNQNLFNITFKLPGIIENTYTFNVKESLNDPNIEALTLQHDIIQTILDKAVKFLPVQKIKTVKYKYGINGLFSLWYLSLKNSYQTNHLIYPVFISSEDNIFITHANKIWDDLIYHPEYFDVKEILDLTESQNIYDMMFAKVQEILEPKYLEMQNSILKNTQKIQNDKLKAFEFRERQINRIGIDNIKKSRLKKLEKERNIWFSNYESSKEIIPLLDCLILLRCTNE
jgi:SNF2 family DNA or RNA helicase